jgi:translocation and assembly module TamA
MRLLRSIILLLVVGAPPASAFETVGLSVSGGADDLRDTLIDSSLVVQARKDDVTDPQEVMAAARSDYARIISVLYENGFFGPTVSIRVDGREAAGISPLDPPTTINRVDIRVTTGPTYTFGDLEISPLAQGTELPEGFSPGRQAETDVIGRSARESIRRWRDIGHAKADIRDQRIVADHRERKVSAAVALDPGPRLTFGELTIVGNEAVSTRRIDKIAGFPTGERYSPKSIEVVSENMRHTGAFRSVILDEAEEPNPDGSLDMTMTVLEQKPRRFGFGAEYSNRDGIELSGVWMHRNIFGGAERLELGGKLTGIGAAYRDVGLEFSIRLTRPATPRSDTDFFLLTDLRLLDERDYTGNNLSFGFGWQRRFSDRLIGEIGLTANQAVIDDDFGQSEYQFLAFPTRLTLDKRNNFVSATNGFYIDTHLLPFLNVKGTSNGARFLGDLRFYEDFLEGDRVVLAARFQLGSIVGPALQDTPNYMLFYSGGGGTVRGHDYQSLGVNLGGGQRTGGRSFLGIAGEIRTRVSDTIEVVGFYDWGYIGAESFPDGTGDSHSGAGLGIRYITPIGPLRVDVGVPVTGYDIGSKFLLYVGIGQAF